jgi:predicted PurR-regulated permease PerM
MNPIIEQHRKKLTIWFKKVMKPTPITVNAIPELIETKPSDIPDDQIRYATPRHIWMFWWIWALVVLLWFAVFQVANMIYLIITWFIVALALERFIQFRQRRGTSRWVALGIAYTILVLFMLSGMVVMIPFVVTQLVWLLNIALESIQNLQTQIQADWLLAVIESSNLPSIIKDRFASQGGDGSWLNLVQWVLSDNVSQIVSVGGESLKTAWSLAVNIVDSVLSVLIQVVVVMTIAVFFSIERIAVFTFIAQLTSRPRHTYVTLQKISMKLGLWLEGQLLLCLIIGVTVGLGLRIISRFGIDLPNKFSLALIAGLTEFIPYLGPILGSAPALLVALLWFWWKGFIVVGIFFWAIQAAENNIIVPSIMSQKLWVNPLLIFLCMLLGASLFGFLGVLLAVPLAVIVHISIQTWYTPEKDTQEK